MHNIGNVVGPHSFAFLRAAEHLQTLLSFEVSEPRNCAKIQGFQYSMSLDLTKALKDIFCV